MGIMTILRTIVYFICWGLSYGLGFGAWSTTLIFPIGELGSSYMFPWYGTFPGVFCGAILGAVFGLSCGVLVALVQALTFHKEVDLPQYRRRLSCAIGLIVAVIAPCLLFKATEGLLWGSDSIPDLMGQPHPLLFSCLALTSIWGGLSAAYTTSLYVSWLARRKINPAFVIEEHQLFDFSLSNWSLTIEDAVIVPALFLVMCGGVIHQLIQVPRNPSAVLHPLVEIGLFTGLTLVIFLVGSILLALNIEIAFRAIKAIFFFDAPETLPSERTRRLMTLIAIVLSGLTCICWPLQRESSLHALLLPWLVIVGVGTYRSYPAFAGSPDKAKRKEKGMPNNEMLDEPTPDSASS